MGLKELKKLAREKEFEEFLLSFGITKADLCTLHENLEKIRNLQVAEDPRPIVQTGKLKDKIEQDARLKMTPEELVKSFAGESVELYENGRNPKK